MFSCHWEACLDNSIENQIDTLNIGMELIFFLKQLYMEKNQYIIIFQIN